MLYEDRLVDYALPALSHTLLTGLLFAQRVMRLSSRWLQFDWKI